MRKLLLLVHMDRLIAAIALGVVTCHPNLLVLARATEKMGADL